MRSGFPAGETKTQMVKYGSSDTSIESPKPIPVSPSDVYKIGVNDVLYIKLGNAAAGSSYYAVRSDGTIDFPLAGEDLNVKGLTVGEVAKNLRRAIKLFSDPKVEVSVSEYASHSVTVSGKVKNPGEKTLRREAVPLFVIRAEAIVDADANAVKITRPEGETQTYRLQDAQTDGLLIHPGTAIEFSTRDFRPAPRYFIAGSQMKTLERTMSVGLTLSSVAASESVDAKKATIHRKDKNGKFTSRDYDLRAIRAGKAADPPIQSDDVIQIRN
jgi:protein involved in polysaccharide export with SLBB domain